MAYGILKCDNITFDNGGSDQNVTVSGLYRATTSGVTVSGTIAAGTVSGVTVIGSTTVSGATVTGTTANFTSGNFSNIISSAATMSGALIMANQQQVRFREAVGNGVNHIALQAPAIVSADQTITLPDQTGTVITTGDNGSVSSTMLATNLTISAAAGSAAAPSIAFTGDLNTGIYSPGADQLAAATNGAQRVFVGSTGNVGIGPSVSLGAKLDVNETGTTSCVIRAKNDTTSVYLDANNGYSYLNTFSNHPMLFGTNNAERLRIDSGGRVGIGTSSPGYALDVAAADTTASAGYAVRIRANATAGAGALQFTDSGATAQYGLLVFGANGVGTLQADGASSRLAFGTNATERVRIDSSGNVGIGTSAGTGKLEVAVSGNRTIGDQWDNKSILIGTPGAFSGNLGLSFDTTNGATIESAAPGVASYPVRIAGSEIQLFTASTERVRIDSSGRLLVGTSSVKTTADVKQEIVNGGLGISRYVNDAFTNALTFTKSRGASNGTIVQSGDQLGPIEWLADDGTSTPKSAALIDCYVDGTPGANDMPGRLVFSTTADGASTPTERMRITSVGHVLIGQTTTSVPGAGNTTEGASVQSGGQLFISKTTGPAGTFNRNSTDGGVVDLRRDGTVVGSISVTTTATAYNTSSDYRLKENVTPVSDGITRLQQLKPSRFNFIADPAKTVDGFLAHEVQTIVPEAITGEKDAVDDDGNPEYQGIDQSKLVPLLTAALQEAIAKIEVLEQRLNDAGIN